MKVILLEKIEKLGKKYDIVEVASGYARNFLLPQEKAQMATKSNLKNLEKMKEREKIIQKKQKEEIEKIIETLNGKEIVIPMKVGEKNQLFESVTKEKISDKLKEEGIEVSEKQINLEKPIKELTEEEVELNFNFGLKTNIKIKITEDK